MRYVSTSSTVELGTAGIVTRGHNDKILFKDKAYEICYITRMVPQDDH